MPAQANHCKEAKGIPSPSVPTLPQTQKGDALLEDSGSPPGKITCTRPQYFKMARACKGPLPFRSTFNTLNGKLYEETFFFFLSRLLKASVGFDLSESLRLYYFHVKWYVWPACIRIK